jgi:putative ABC transport system substrate-binding protein
LYRDHTGKIQEARQRERRPVSDETENFTNRATIVELAAKGRIPTIYSYREFVEVGGLMAYSIDPAEIYRRLANLIDKIFRGANPGDIPFYQPNKFELSINLKLRKRSARNASDAARPRR